MKLNKLLASFITLSIFLVGCDGINETPTASDKANQQRTMTKVQNDVNEIMHKDYEYVLNNMGTPYSTTYWLDKEKINSIQTLDDLNENGIIGLVYPKYTADNELEGSALYIELNNNQVVEVQTYNFNPNITIDEDLDDDTVVVIDKHSNTNILDINKIEDINLDALTGENINNLYEKLNYVKPDINAYDMLSKTKLAKIYILKENNIEINKALVLFLNNEIIEKINIVDNRSIVQLVKDYFNRYERL